MFYFPNICHRCPVSTTRQIIIQLRSSIDKYTQLKTVYDPMHSFCSINLELLQLYWNGKTKDFFLFHFPPWNRGVEGRRKRVFFFILFGYVSALPFWRIILSSLFFLLLSFSVSIQFLKNKSYYNNNSSKKINFPFVSPAPRRPPSLLLIAKYILLSFAIAIHCW